MEKEAPYTVEGKSGTLSQDSTPHASLGNDDAHQAGSCFLNVTVAHLRSATAGGIQPASVSLQSMPRL